MTLAWDGLCGCDGFIEIDGGWAGRKARWSWQGPRERTGVGEGTGTGSLFLPGSSGCQTTPMQTAPLRVPVQMTVRQR